MFSVVHNLNCFLNNTRLVCSLRLVGRLFQPCTARGMKVFFAVSVLKFLVSLRRWTPTLSASFRVVRPGWSPICSYKYTGFLSILVLKSKTRLWYTTNWFMLSQPHCLSNTLMGVPQGNLVTHRAALF